MNMTKVMKRRLIQLAARLLRPALDEIKREDLIADNAKLRTFEREADGFGLTGNDRTRYVFERWCASKTASERRLLSEADNDA